MALDAYIAQLGLPKKAVPLRKGQAIVWAANAFHGGEPIQQPGRTRYSQVTHFYFDRCLYTQPPWSDLHGGRVMYKKVFDISANRYVQSWYNGQQFSTARGGTSASACGRSHQLLESVSRPA